jgi:hypothetical protein
MPTLRVAKPPSGQDDRAQVVEGERVPAWEQGAALAVVGRPHPRLEGTEKVTGRARYADDVRLPRRLAARVLRSPLPHARIKRIDTNRAEALPGRPRRPQLGRRPGDPLVRREDPTLRPHAPLRRRRGRRRRR